MQAEEVDTLLLGVLHLLEARRHLGFGATIDECHLCTKALRSAARVHSRIAATDYEHLLGLVDGRVGLRVGCIHEVHASEILV